MLMYGYANTYEMLLWLMYCAFIANYIERDIRPNYSKVHLAVKFPSNQTQ